MTKPDYVPEEPDNLSELIDKYPAPDPDDIHCPVCGRDPSPESLQNHKLSALGYLHDDVVLHCSSDACGHTWVLGRPVGEYDAGEDLVCLSCESSYVRIHRVKYLEDEAVYKLHTKCPECYYFKKIKREPDEGGLALVGYPDITGTTENAKAYGYPADTDDE